MARLKYLSYTTLFLKYSILYPIDEDNSPLRKLLYRLWRWLFVSGIVTTFFPAVVHLSTKKIDLVEDTMTVMDTTIYFAACWNLILFNRKLSDLRRIVERINTVFAQRSDNGFEEVTMEGPSRFLDIQARFWITVGITGISLGTISPLILHKRSLSIAIWTPYNLTASPQFELTFAWQLLTQINMSFVHSTSDIAYLGVLLLTAQQFKILASNLKYSFHNALLKMGVKKEAILEFVGPSGGNKYSPSQSIFQQFKVHGQILETLSSEEFLRVNADNLKRNIRHHQMLLRHCDDVESFFSPIMLAKIGSAIFYIVFMAFTTMTMQKGTVIMIFLIYVMAGSGQIFIYNFAGQMLTESSDMSWVMYECPWYLCDSRWKSTFLMMQMRCAKMIYSRAGGYFVMSAPFFITFMKSIFSYLAILREVTNDDEK